MRDHLGLVQSFVQGAKFAYRYWKKHGPSDFLDRFKDISIEAVPVFILEEFEKEIGWEETKTVKMMSASPSSSFDFSKMPERKDPDPARMKKLVQAVLQKYPAEYIVAKDLETGKDWTVEEIIKDLENGGDIYKSFAGTLGDLTKLKDAFESSYHGYLNRENPVVVRGSAMVSKKEKENIHHKDILSEEMNDFIKFKTQGHGPSNLPVHRLKEWKKRVMELEKSQRELMDAYKLINEDYEGYEDE